MAVSVANADTRDSSVAGAILYSRCAVGHIESGTSVLTAGVAAGIASARFTGPVIRIMSGSSGADEMSADV